MDHRIQIVLRDDLFRLVLYQRRVVTNTGSDNISVLLGSSDGTFGAAVNYTVGYGPVSVAIGNLNGGRIPDLVVANPNSDDVSVLLGVGDGTFAAAIDYPTGREPFFVAMGDLNGDQVLDLVVANTLGDDVTVLLNQSADCNSNGVLDIDDVANNTSVDCNDNGFPDECEPDCNGNMQADSCDIVDQSSPDCDDNVVPDECDPDFDGDGQIDACDDDIDNDAVPNESDICDFTVSGSPVTPHGHHISDTNENCVIDLTDYGRLRVRCLIFGGPNQPTDNPFCLSRFDLDGDADIDLRDVAGFTNSFGS